LYAICNPQKWTIIINADKDDWGLSYNAKKDVARIEVPVQKCDAVAEAFTMYFSDEKNITNLNILWDDVKVALPISF
jgi:hypothetical protein